MVYRVPSHGKYPNNELALRANEIMLPTGAVLLIEFIWFCIFPVRLLRNENVDVVMPFNEPRKLIFCRTFKDVFTCASVNVVNPLTFKVLYKTRGLLPRFARFVLTVFICDWTSLETFLM